MRELVAMLSVFPLETRVLVDGYEYGLTEVRRVERAGAALDVDEACYYAGEHAEAGAEDYRIDGRRETLALVDVVVISRKEA